MQIEVAYATPEQQTLLQLEVAVGTTIEQALQISGLPHGVAVGVFGKIRSLDWQLQAGDRVEIYRPLRVDPKIARLERARKFRSKKV